MVKPPLPTDLVRECTTMSAPWAMGRINAGVAMVASTMSGISWRWATAATAAMSAQACWGLEGISTYRNRVPSSTSFSHSSISHGRVTQRTWAPRSRMRRLNSWNVPPYTWAAETKFRLRISPSRISRNGSTACLIADIPAEVQSAVVSAPVPYPSSNARVSSR